MIYGKIEDNKFVEAPPTLVDGGITIVGFNQNIVAMENNGYSLFSNDILWKLGNGMAIIKDNQIEDVSENKEYKDKIRLQEIDTEFEKATSDYNISMDTPVVYPINGKMYKPKYAQESYMAFFQAEQLTKMMNSAKTIFPILIKDSTKLEENAVFMSITDLLQLTSFLGTEATNLWNIKAKVENDLLLEKNSILELLNQ